MILFQNLTADSAITNSRRAKQSVRDTSLHYKAKFPGATAVACFGIYSKKQAKALQDAGWQRAPKQRTTVPGQWAFIKGCFEGREVVDMGTEAFIR